MQSFKYIPILMLDKTYQMKGVGKTALFHSVGMEGIGNEGSEERR